MRQLQVQVHADKAHRVMEIGNAHDAFSPTAVRAQRVDGDDWSIVFLNLPNKQVGKFVEAVEEEVEDAQFVLVPRGTIAIQTPLSDVQERVRHVSTRSQLELVLSSLQSVGSWSGLLSYALFSGLVAAYAVIFNTSFLLVAAMLISPMGAPIMVCVVGTAIGDWKMFGRGALRFVVALVILAMGALVLGFAYGLSFSTALMEQVSSLSNWIVMLALVGGAAGAQAQIQADRDSLVTGTATGFLITVALSPPAAVLGLAASLGRWGYVAQMAFLLTLTFAGIITGGWLTLLAYGVKPQRTRARSGSNTARIVLATVAAASVIALVVWQSHQEPRFQKADLSRQAIEISREVVNPMPDALLLEANAHFTRSDLPNRSAEALLLTLTVERRGGTTADSQLSMRIREAVQQRMRSRFPSVLPFVDVTVLSTP